MKQSPYEKRMLRLIRQIRRSACEGVIITEKDSDIKNEFLKVCDRLELRLQNTEHLSVNLVV